MTILKAVPGLEVQILVDGQPLPEYENDEEPGVGKTMTKHIEAQSGKEFAIKYKQDDSFYWRHRVRISVYMDGAPSPIRCKLDGGKNCNGYIIPGPVSKIGTKLFQQKLLFRELVITEECPKLSKDLLDKVNDIGTIKVTFDWGTKLGHQELTRVNPKDAQNLSSGKGTFRETLRALHIIPRDPTPVPLEDRPIAELNAAELRELLELERNKRSAQGVKKEPISIKSESVNGTKIKEESEPATKRKRELNIDDDGIEVVEVREVCKRMKRVNIDAEEVVELE